MKPLALLCLLVLAPGIARASLVSMGTTLSDSGAFEWAYAWRLSSAGGGLAGSPQSLGGIADQAIAFGGFVDTLTLRDFAGYVGGSCTGPAGWTCSAQAVGQALGTAAPFDDPAIQNLTWVREPGRRLPSASDGLDWRKFTAESFYDTPTRLSYVVSRFDNIEWAGGTGFGRVGFTEGPSAAVVPEPASVALAGLGLALMGLARRGHQSTARRAGDRLAARHCEPGRRA